MPLNKAPTLGIERSSFFLVYKELANVVKNIF